MKVGNLDFISTLAGFYPDLKNSEGSDPPQVPSRAIDSKEDPRGVRPLNFISFQFQVRPVDFIFGRLGLWNLVSYIFIILEVWYLDFIMWKVRLFGYYVHPWCSLSKVWPLIFFYPTWGLVPILFSDVSPLQFRSNLHQPWLMKSPAKLASNCNNEVSCVEHCWHVYQTGMFFRRAQKGFAGVRLSGKQPVGLLFQGFDPPLATQRVHTITLTIYNMHTAIYGRYNHHSEMGYVGWHRNGVRGSPPQIHHRQTPRLYDLTDFVRWLLA